MATYPYCDSPQDLRKAIEELQKGTFPAEIEDVTIKFWKVSPANKEGIIQVFHFLSFVDKEGKRTEKGMEVFSIQDAQIFDQQFGECVQNAYARLFEHYRNRTWSLKVDQLIDFFGVIDGTDKSIGWLQASTFQVLVDFLSVSYISPQLKSVSPHQILRWEFQRRNLHPKIHDASEKLFRDGHFPDATFAALRIIEGEVQRLSGLTGQGQDLMQKAFIIDDKRNKKSKIEFSSDKEKQDGHRFLFAGAMSVIRNPRAHGLAPHETKDQCLNHLSLVSLLLEKLESAKVNS